MTQSNQIRLKDGIIEIIEVGDQTEETIKTLTAKAASLSKDLERVLILVDVSEVAHVSIGARVAAKEISEQLAYEKMAFVGASPLLAAMVRFISKATRNKRSTEFFKNRDQAINWLKQ